MPKDILQVGPLHRGRIKFKPGQSGNPKGAKRKTPSIALDLKALLERALNAKVKLPRGERDKFLTNAAAGMEQLADQFAKGDPRARRDLIPICERLGVDLTNRKALEGALEDALSAEDEALLADFVKRHGGQYPLAAEHGTPQAKDANLVTSPTENAKLLAPPSENLIDTQIRQDEGKFHE